MFSQKQQQKIFITRFSNIQLYLKQYCLKPNEDALHKLRVEIKKLRAIGRFIDECNNNHLITKALRPVTAIFRQAAQIRSIHIHLKYTQNLSAGKFRKEQLKLQQQKELLFVSKLTLFTERIKKAQSKLTHLGYPIKQKAIVKWYKQNLKRAYRRVKGGESKFHSARKIIKRLLYANDVVSSSTGVNKVYLKQLEELLGHWHDLSESIALLRKRYSAEKKTIALLDKKIKKTLTQLQALITNFKTLAPAKK